MFVANLLVAFVAIHGSLSHLQNPVVDEDSNDGLWWYRRFSPPESKRKQVSERELWHRMLQENLTCSDSSKSERNEHQAIMATANHLSGLLTPMGFSEMLRTYVQRNPQTSSCAPPPTAASCQSTKYSVVMYSAGNDLRQLVTRVMSLQSYPSVARINLIILGSKDSPRHILEDTKYGKRILKWKDQGIINVIQRPSSLWEAMDFLQVGGDPNGLLWIDADMPKVWNGTTFKARLRAWKEQPNSLAIQSMNTHHTCPFPFLHGMMMHPNHLCYLSHAATRELRVHSESSTDSWELSTRSIGIFLFFIADFYLVDPTVDRLPPTQRLSSRDALKDETTTILSYFDCSCFAPSHRSSKLPDQCQ